ncbi:hypothetical protein ACFHW2_12570 [Actinomadura sp. LOL_016]|uniref:hypothetical protein n=1 Tax=unclassified Actinomadura TaxID=2626254 RepID=UPI003A7FB79E
MSFETEPGELLGVVADAADAGALHRLTQAASADRVVVMDGGRVVESGTHADQRDAGGAYAALWAAWSGTRDA